jgi:hypothetical protein
MLFGASFFVDFIIQLLYHVLRKNVYFTMRGLYVS